MAEAVTVHNHRPDERAGLACREFLVNGELKGECITGSYGRRSGALRDRIAAVVHQYCVPITMAEHVADAILALPGIAVIELPELMGTERDHVAESMRDHDMWEQGQSWATLERVDRIYMEAGTAYGSVSPAIARDLAAALLAAADHAEREQ